MVCDGPALRLFSVSELEVLICGSPKFDFFDLEESCLYQVHQSFLFISFRWCSLFSNFDPFFRDLSLILNQLHGFGRLLTLLHSSKRKNCWSSRLGVTVPLLEGSKT